MRRAKGQIYLCSEVFIAKDVAPNNGVKDTPQVQLRAARAVAEADIRKKREESDSRAYDHGCDNEIGAHLGVRYDTVSRRLKQIEHTN